VLVSATAAAGGAAAAGVDRLMAAAGIGQTGASCAALGAGILAAASAAHLLGVVQPRERSLMLSVFDRSGRRDTGEPATPAP
jgi:hypothetical protein